MNRIFINDLRIRRVSASTVGTASRTAAAGEYRVRAALAQVFTSDRFEDALDYSAVVKRLQALAADHTHKMLERFCRAMRGDSVPRVGAPWARQSGQAGAARGQAERRCDRARHAHLKVRPRKQSAYTHTRPSGRTKARPEDAVRKISLIGDAACGEAGRSEFAFQSARENSRIPASTRASVKH